MPTNTGTALKSRERARERRLAKTRERRLQLDPERMERDRRIDEAAVDLEDARESLAKATAEQAAAELRMAAAVERLLAEKLTMGEVGRLTGLEQPQLRRLGRLRPRARVTPVELSPRIPPTCQPVRSSPVGLGAQSQAFTRIEPRIG